MDSIDCPMCLAREVGRKWTRDIVGGHKTVMDATVFFKINSKDVNDHIDNHEIICDDAGGFDSPDFFMKQLLIQLKYLKDWLSYTTISGGNMSREDIELSIKLSREIRATVETLGEFQGRLSSSPQVTINIENLNQKYLAITNLLLTEACDDCKIKVIDLIDEMDKPKEIASR